MKRVLIFLFLFPAVARGRRVNLVSETDKSLVRERHEAKDLDV